MALKVFRLFFKNGSMTTASSGFDLSLGGSSEVKDALRHKCTVQDFLVTGKCGDNLTQFIDIKKNDDVIAGAVLCTFKNGYKIVVDKVLSTNEISKRGLTDAFPPTLNRLSAANIIPSINIASGVLLSPVIKRFKFAIYSPSGEDKTREYFSSKYCPDNLKNTNYFDLWLPVSEDIYNKTVINVDWDLQTGGTIFTRCYMNFRNYASLDGSQKNYTYSEPIDDIVWSNKPFITDLLYFGHLIAIALFSDNAVETNKGDDTGGESTSGGQNGNFDDTSDNIDVPTLPVTNASSCGMVKMYEMSLAQTQALAGYLWSGAKEFYENLTKMFNDPMDSIISLSLAPIKPSVSAQTTVEICKYAIDSVTGFPLTSQYAILDCGTITIIPYWGNALDYAPYTKASIYLPFIGTQELNIDDVMNRTVGVIYNIDLLSGACACMITCDGSVMYNFSGNVISQIPVSGKNALEMYKSVISAVTNTALAIGTGAGGVALAGDVVSNGLSVMGSKMTVQRGGTISATNGVLGVKFPYITILRANQSLPADFHYFKGYPSNISGKVSSFSGYTEVEYVHVAGINATENELEMIEQILKEGFII